MRKSFKWTFCVYQKAAMIMPDELCINSAKVCTADERCFSSQWGFCYTSSNMLTDLWHLTVCQIFAEALSSPWEVVWDLPHDLERVSLQNPTDYRPHLSSKRLEVKREGLAFQLWLSGFSRTVILCTNYMDYIMIPLRYFLKLERWKNVWSNTRTNKW